MVDTSSFVVPEYQGGYSSLEPSSGEGFVGYRSDINTLGLSTDPRSANILQEINTKLAPGQKHIELSLISPELIDTVPKQHLKEANRLAKLTGTDVTVHGPLVEPSGLTKEGFTETNRELVERQMLRAMEAAHEINPKGGVPVTFHSAGMLPASEIRKVPESELKKLSKEEREERGIVNKEESHKILILDQETGQMHAAKRDTKYYPTQLTRERTIQKRILTPERQVQITNDSQWSTDLSQLLAAKHRTDTILDQTYDLAKPIYDALEVDKNKKLTDTEKELYSKMQNASSQLEDLRMHLDTLYNKAYKYGTEENRKELGKISLKFITDISVRHPTENVTVASNDPKIQSHAVQNLMENLRSMEHSPKVHIKLEDFAMKKSTQTFANTAFQAYEKYGESSPIISIENPPAGMFGLSRGEDLKNMVVGSREKFVEKMVKEKNMGEGEAKEIAEKMIGVTWDVGHINQLRKAGFTEKDVIKETEKIAPYLKHVHLSDNFGVENVELPMGMGNVPLKEMMEKLGKKGKEARKIVEAGNWWTQFRINPMGQTFENLGSPMYAGGMESSPYWNQSVGLQQGYFGGYGQMLPQINYETFGAGFSNLPMELGGQRQGAQGSRMSGKGME